MVSEQPVKGGVENDEDNDDDLEDDHQNDELDPLKGCINRDASFFINNINNVKQVSIEQKANHEKKNRNQNEIDQSN